MEKEIRLKGKMNFSEHFNKKYESVAIYLFFLIIFSIYLWTMGIKSKVDIFTSLIVLLLGCFIIVKVWMYRRKKIFEHSNIRKEHLYTINNEGIKRKIGNNLLEIKWENIEKTVENKDTFKIFVTLDGKKQVRMPNEFFNKGSRLDALEMINPIFIPKRFFRNSDELKKFEDIIMKKSKLIKK